MINRYHDQAFATVSRQSFRNPVERDLERGQKRSGRATRPTSCSATIDRCQPASDLRTIATKEPSGNTGSPVTTETRVSFLRTANRKKEKKRREPNFLLTTSAPRRAESKNQEAEKVKLVAKFLIVPLTLRGSLPSAFGSIAFLLFSVFVHRLQTLLGEVTGFGSW